MIAILGHFPELVHHISFLWFCVPVVLQTAILPSFQRSSFTVGQARQVYRHHLEAIPPPVVSSTLLYKIRLTTTYSPAGPAGLGYTGSIHSVQLAGREGG